MNEKRGKEREKFREGKVVCSCCNSQTAALQNLTVLGSRKGRKKGQAIGENDLQAGNFQFLSWKYFPDCKVTKEASLCPFSLGSSGSTIMPVEGRRELSGIGGGQGNITISDIPQHDDALVLWKLFSKIVLQTIELCPQTRVLLCDDDITSVHLQVE